jgi:hypothetical protein
MIRRAVATLTGLGLIGGAATVAYNKHGDATVRIKDSAGHVHTVVIGGNGGKTFSCPDGTDAKLKPHDIRAGRIKLTLEGVRRSERAIERRFTAGVAPHAVVVRFNSLAHRDNRLVDAYNAEIDEHNAIISRDCKPG